MDTVPETATILCTYSGQYVIYYNERVPGRNYPSDYYRYARADLCEVEVYGEYISIFNTWSIYIYAMQNRLSTSDLCVYDILIVFNVSPETGLVIWRFSACFHSYRKSHNCISRKIMRWRLFSWNYQNKQIGFLKKSVW